MDLLLRKHTKGGGNRTSSFSFLVGVLQGRIQSSRFLLFFSPVFFNEIHAFRPLKKKGAVLMENTLDFDSGGGRDHIDYFHSK